jgi:hypothetical protein
VHGLLHAVNGPSITRLEERVAAAHPGTAWKKTDPRDEPVESLPLSSEQVAHLKNLGITTSWHILFNDDGTRQGRADFLESVTRGRHQRALNEHDLQRLRYEFKMRGHTWLATQGSRRLGDRRAALLRRAA